MALSLALQKRASLVAARILFGISILCLGSCIGLVVYSLIGSEMPVALGLAIAPIWILAIISTSRACSAAKYLAVLRNTKL